MSATRYSGDVKITLTYRDRQDDYRATITWPVRLHAPLGGRPRKSGGRWGSDPRHTVFVGAPKWSDYGVDSPEAFDSTAHAALSFGSEEEPEIAEHAAMDEQGWYIARSELLRWGGPLHEETVKRRAKAARSMGPVARGRARR